MPLLSFISHIKPKFSASIFLRQRDFPSQTDSSTRSDLGRSSRKCLVIALGRDLCP